MMQHGSFHSRLAKGLGVSLCLFLLGGCGPSGVVSGKVSYKGSTLNGGQVLFLTEDGKLLTSQIDAEGSYSISKVPAGTVRIGLVPSQGGTPVPTVRGPGTGKPIGVLPKEGQGGPPAEFREGFKPKPPDPKLKDFPKTYKDPETSGLTFSATGGPQTYPIELK